MKRTVVSPHALYGVYTLMYQYAWLENIDYLIILKIILPCGGLGGGGLLLERGACLVGGCLFGGEGLFKEIRSFWNWLVRAHC